MEKSVLKVSVGIDMAKDTFYCAIIYLMFDQITKCKGTRKFSNTVKGFDEFMKWVDRKVKVDNTISYTMESTGVYYENLACFLYHKDLTVNVVLPNKAKKFAESLDNKSKTDKLDALSLGRMGAVLILRSWNPGSKIYVKLKKYTRERETIQNDRTRLKNMIHAENHSAFGESVCIKRFESRLKMLDRHLKAVDKDIRRLLNSDTEVQIKVNKIKTIPGISTTTIAVVIAETYGFAAFTNMKQVASFAGYDIVFKESGQYSGKTRISKKGNSHIRRALYMPTLSAIRYNETYNEFYNRLNERKNNGLISGTAVQRKLICLMYTLWKNDTEFVPNYKKLKSCVSNVNAA